MLWGYLFECVVRVLFLNGDSGAIRELLGEVRGLGEWKRGEWEPDKYKYKHKNEIRIK